MCILNKLMQLNKYELRCVPQKDFYLLAFRLSFIMFRPAPSKKMKCTHYALVCCAQLSENDVVKSRSQRPINSLEVYIKLSFLSMLSDDKVNS